MNLRWAVTLSMMAAFAANSSGLAADTSPQLDGWTITAGRIKVAKATVPGGAKEVRGSFTMKSNLEEPGTRRAGACFLADLTEQMVGKSSCTDQDECESDYRVAPPNAPAGSVDTSELLFGGEGHGYCISPNKQEPKRCWTRPGPDSDYCRKDQFAPGKYAVPGLDPASGAVRSVSADPLGNGKPVRWLILGCLNPEHFGQLPPCADPASDLEVISIGPEKRVKP